MPLRSVNILYELSMCYVVVGKNDKLLLRCNEEKLNSAINKTVTPKLRDHKDTQGFEVQVTF